MNDLIVLRPEGLYCPAGDFYIDPHKRVPRAVVTHAHGDHAKSGCGRYWTAASGYKLLRHRLGAGAQVRPLEYGQRFDLNGVQISLHPAGHILGSAQLRLEHEGRVWVVSGDYKREPDPSCEPFESVPCEVFVTEATFASPEYVWAPAGEAAREIHQWWMENRAQGQASVLFCYALGKAQRVLAELLAHAPQETVYLHTAMMKLVSIYRQQNVAMLPTLGVSQVARHQDFRGALILVPPHVFGTSWLHRLQPYRSGFASGWMGVDGARARRYDRGFAMSDHADWPALLQTIRDSGARRVLAMHGETATLIATLQAQGISAEELRVTAA